MGRCADNVHDCRLPRSEAASCAAPIYIGYMTAGGGMPNYATIARASPISRDFGTVDLDFTLRPAAKARLDTCVLKPATPAMRLTGSESPPAGGQKAIVSDGASVARESGPSAQGSARSVSRSRLPESNRSGETPAPDRSAGNLASRPPFSEKQRQPKLT
jgi:hypothetical protein